MKFRVPEPLDFILQLLAMVVIVVVVLGSCALLWGLVYCLGGPWGCAIMLIALIYPAYWYLTTRDK